MAKNVPGSNFCYYEVAKIKLKFLKIGNMRI